MKDMAEELHVAVIGIAHFNKKDDIKSALVRALAAVGAFCPSSTLRAGARDINY
jgi:hypothetical protein